MSRTAVHLRRLGGEWSGERVTGGAWWRRLCGQRKTTDESGGGRSMRIRIDHGTYRELGVVADAIGSSRAEVVRRCLLRWVRAGRPGVVVPNNGQSTTRDNSEGYAMDLGGLDEGLSGGEVLAVVRWRLGQLDWRHVRESRAVRRRYDREAERAGCEVVVVG